MSILSAKSWWVQVIFQWYGGMHFVLDQHA